MKVPDETYDTVFSAIDARQDEFVATLKEAVAIPSVSSDPSHRHDCIKMVMWTKKATEKIESDIEQLTKLMMAARGIMQEGEVTLNVELLDQLAELYTVA